MMKKIYSIVFFLALVLSYAYGQQEPIYSQYMINPFVVNPAVSSTEDYIDFQSGYRSQWGNFDGGPRTIYLSGHATINKPFYHMHYKAEHKNWHGIGFQLMDDRIGPFHRNTFLVAYSYNIGLFGRTRLSIGAFAGVKQMQTNQGYWENIPDDSDFLFRDNISTGVKPEVQFGASMYSKDYYVNLSTQNLIGNKDLTPGSTEGSATEKFRIHTYLSAGKRFYINSNLFLTPSTMIRYTPTAPISFDLNGKLEMENQFWGGMSLRKLEALNVFVGMLIQKKVELTYAYEAGLGQLSSYHSGTHEIIIGLRLEHPQTVLNPSSFWEK